MTRVAWLAPHMWAELFMENKEFLLKEIDCYIEHLSEYKTAMEHDDRRDPYPTSGRGQEEKGRGGRLMRSIHIKASREYDVLVERGLLDRAGELLREVSAPGMAAIVSDDTVYALYGERTVKAP